MSGGLLSGEWADVVFLFANELENCAALKSASEEVRYVAARVDREMIWSGEQ